MARHNLFAPHACSAKLKEWKALNGIQVDFCCIQAENELPSNDDELNNKDLFPINLLFYTNAAISTSKFKPPSTTGSNKEDTLTQSQMQKKSADKADLIASQKTEIDGLIKFDVMDIHPISSLPSCTRLLSSIWSYLRKHLPNGILLKHKSRICVNGKEQSFGHIYWETYAPIASWVTIWMQSFPRIFSYRMKAMLRHFWETKSQNTQQKNLTFTQPHLIQQILSDVGVSSNSNGKETPADTILHDDPNGPEQTQTWNYHSMIGKLNYLVHNTRPNISMAVHQCAQYHSAPRALHDLAVKHIARYLLSTQDKGIKLHPTTNLSPDMHVDADFVGRWHKEYSELRNSIVSLTGYIISFCGCPVTWCSKLQS